MKKLFLLSALICVSALNSMKRLQCMEPLYPQRDVLAGQWENLPPEIIFHIINAGDLDEAIKNIVSLSQVNKELNEMLNYNDLKGFTRIVHVLANKFSIYPEHIAQQFNTPVAQTYSDLYVNLFKLVTHEQYTTEVKNLLDEGLVDINAGPLLYWAVKTRLASKMPIAPMIKLLLEYGANPYVFQVREQPQVQAALNELNRRKTQTTQADYEQAKALLEEALRRQQ